MIVHGLKCQRSEQYTKLVFEAENHPDMDNLNIEEHKIQAEKIKDNPT